MLRGLSDGVSPIGFAKLAPMATTKDSVASSPIAKAREKLHEAEISLRELQSATTLAEAERRWRAVLVALKTLWEKVKAVRIHPKASGWWGEQVRTRFEDQLLAYLTAARNADEHRLEDTVVREDGTIRFQVPPGGKPVHLTDIVVDSAGRISLRSTGPVALSATPGRVRVLSVINRAGHTVQPPKEHLGAALPDAEPWRFAPSAAPGTAASWRKRTRDYRERVSDRSDLAAAHLHAGAHCQGQGTRPTVLGARARPAYSPPRRLGRASARATGAHRRPNPGRQTAPRTRRIR
jgi:hypothetical protein